MAGWLIVWAPQAEVDIGRWERSVRAAGRYGEPVEDLQIGRARIAAWRRPRGEFPHSGRLHHGSSQSVVAWLGQCLEDRGDASEAVIDTLAGVSPDLTAVASLNGQFAAAVLDEHGDRISICTDRHRHYPIYLYRGSSFSAASSDLTCLLPWVVKPDLDSQSVSLLLFTGELVDRMTLVKGVELLPAATFLEDDRGRLSERRYWRLEFRPQEGRAEGDWADRIAFALRAAVGRIEAAGSRLGVPLSGGLDSRLLLGLCARPSSVPSFTWGFPRCRDRVYAAEFARAVHSAHHAYDWRLDAFPPMWAEGIDRTAGMFGIQDMFVLPYASVLAEHCDAVLNGLAGDVLLGGNFLKRTWLREKSIERLTESVWRWRVSPEQEAWAQRLTSRDAATQNVLRLWIESLGAWDGYKPAHRLHGWLFENRIFRFTNSGTLLLRAAIESYAPFFDRDVVDLLMAVPLEFKWKHRLYLEVLKRVCPAAAHVPWQKTAVPPDWGFPATLSAMAAHKAIRLVCKPLGIEPFPGQSVANVPGWLRGEWALAVESILLDSRTLDRRVMDPDALRAMWQAHRQGRDCTRQLGIALAIEVFARTVLDCFEPARGVQPALVG